MQKVLPHLHVKDIKETFFRHWAQRGFLILSFLILSFLILSFLILSLSTFFVDGEGLSINLSNNSVFIGYYFDGYFNPNRQISVNAAMQ